MAEISNDASETVDELHDYYNVVYDSLIMVPEDKWMDCFVLMIEEISAFKNKTN